MTTPAQLSVSVVPGSVQVSSPGEYQVVSLTLTIANVTSAPVDLSGGLTVSLPADPGGGGSQEALVLTEASIGAAGGIQPVVAITPGVATGVPWTIAADTASPGPCDYVVLPAGNGILPAGASVVLTFDDVVPDFTPGQAEITVSVLPASPEGSAITLTAAIVKTPAPLIATLSAVPSLLTVPDNTTRLSWQVLGAALCELTWDPPTTVVSYGGQQYEAGAWADPPFQFGPGDPLPVATLIEDTEFTLTANGQGAEVTAPQAVTLGKPRLYALTIPPLTDRTAPADTTGGASGAPGTPLVSGVTQDGPGDPHGGQAVTVSGSGLAGAASVSFGSTTTTLFTVVSDSQLTVTAPPAAEAAATEASAPGTVVDVTVTQADGATSPATPAGRYTYANLLSAVPPYQPFQLTWSCFNGTEPHLSWGPDQQVPVSVNDPVTVTAGPNAVSPATVLPASGSAVATVTTPTIFSMTTAAFPAPAPLHVGVTPVAVTGLPPSTPAVSPVDGSQSVTLSWTPQNATALTLKGGMLTDGVDLPYNASSYPISPLTGLATFTLTADGFDTAGRPAQATASWTVQPLPVVLTVSTPPSVQAQVTDPATGRQSVTVAWKASNATGITITGGAQVITPGIHDTSAVVELPYPPPGPPGPVTFPVEIKAAGYFPRAEIVTVVPTPVQLVSLSPAQTTISASDHFTLAWVAVAATGFTLRADYRDPPVSVTQDLGAAVRLSPQFPGRDVTYVLTALGYPGGAALPAATAQVVISKYSKEGKEKEKERSIENIDPGAGQPPSPAPGDLAAEDAGLPEGTQRTYLTTDERSDPGPG